MGSHLQGSQLGASICLTLDSSILLHAQVVDGRLGLGSLRRTGCWCSTTCTPSFIGYPLHLAGLSVFPYGPWSAALMPPPRLGCFAGIQALPWENGHSEMPRANDLWLLRMFWSLNRTVLWLSISLASVAPWIFSLFSKNQLISLSYDVFPVVLVFLWVSLIWGKFNRLWILTFS